MFFFYKWRTPIFMKGLSVGFLVAHTGTRASELLELAATGGSHQQGSVLLNGDVFDLLGSLIREFLVLRYQGFGDGLADWVNLGHETTTVYADTHDHAPESLFQKQKRFRSLLCGSLFHLSELFARFAARDGGCGLFLVSEDCTDCRGLHGCGRRQEFLTGQRRNGKRPVLLLFNRCLFLLLFNIVLKILGNTVKQETKLRNIVILNEERTINIYK